MPITHLNSSISVLIRRPPQISAEEPAVQRLDRGTSAATMQHRCSQARGRVCVHMCVHVVVVVVVVVVQGFTAASGGCTRS